MEPIVFTVIALVISAGSLLVSYISMQGSKKASELSMSKEEHSAYEVRLRNLEIKTEILNANIESGFENVDYKLSVIIKELDRLERRSYHD